MPRWSRKLLHNAKLGFGASKTAPGSLFRFPNPCGFTSLRNSSVFEIAQVVLLRSEELTIHSWYICSRNSSVLAFRQYFTYWPGAYPTCKNEGRPCLSSMKGNHVHSILEKKAACLCYHTRQLHHTYVQANTSRDVVAKQTVSCPGTVKPPD